MDLILERKVVPGARSLADASTRLTAAIEDLNCGKPKGSERGYAETICITIDYFIIVVDA